MHRPIDKYRAAAQKVKNLDIPFSELYTLSLWYFFRIIIIDSGKGRLECWGGGASMLPIILSKAAVAPSHYV